MAVTEKTYEISERIIQNITKKIKDPLKQQFLLEILGFELDNLDNPKNVRYKEYYEEVLADVNEASNKK